MPLNQTKMKDINRKLRSPIKSILTIGGREIDPNPTMHDSCQTISELNITKNQNKSTLNTLNLTRLPYNSLSHMQCVVLDYIFVKKQNS